MTTNEYLNASFALGNYLDIGWLMSIFGTPMGDSEYYKDGMYKLGEDFVDVGKARPLIRPESEFTLLSTSLGSADKDIETTVGTAVMNAVLLDLPFKSEIKFVDELTSAGKLVDTLMDARGYMKEPDWVEGLKLYSVAMTYLTQLTTLVTKVVNKEMLSKPTGIDKFKADLTKEYIKKYGDDAFKSPAVIAEFRGRLMEYDKAFLKKSVDDGYVLATGKVANVSRPKYYLTIGQPASTTGDDVHFIESSLDSDEMLTATEFAAAVDEIRNGSASRGSDTQLGGVIYSIITRATHPYVIAMDDCKSKDALPVLGTYAIIGGYVIEGGKTVGPITKENVGKYLGKQVRLRSFTSCKAKGATYCKKCVGDTLAMLKDGLLLACANTASAYLLVYMKGMHDSALAIEAINPNDMFT